MFKRKIKEKFIYSENGTYSKETLRVLFRDFRIFVLLTLLVFWKTGNEPVVLIGGVITFLSVEVWQLARIKIAEVEEDLNEDKLEE